MSACHLVDVQVPPGNVTTCQVVRVVDGWTTNTHQLIFGVVPFAVDILQHATISQDYNYDQWTVKPECTRSVTQWHLVAAVVPAASQHPVRVRRVRRRRRRPPHASSNYLHYPRDKSSLG